MLRRLFRELSPLRTRLTAFLVAIHGLLIIADTLISQFGMKRFPGHVVTPDIIVDVPLLLGLALLYLSFSLRRRRHNAWVCAIVLYLFLFGLNTNVLLGAFHAQYLSFAHVFTLLLPIALLALFWSARKDFVVRSDIQTFKSSLLIATLVLGTTFLYGTTGFMLMDRHDFHQEISLPAAMHYTVDQFSLTTNPLQAHTRRAALFQDSLTFVSVTSLGFVLLSLFQPLRARYTHQKERYAQAKKLIYASSHDSEDIFKLWPHDKTYFFCENGHAGLAYKVQRGVALVVGDPFGAIGSAQALLQEFEDFCFVNDWQPAFIHTTALWKPTFVEAGYRVQLIGKEAVVSVNHFVADVATAKYFREISRRFTKLGYRVEFLSPPHTRAITQRLKAISAEWLERPGRSERGFMMGYFSEAYLQESTLAVARDNVGVIQAFMNIVSSPLPAEANYDMMRASKQAAGNINDYMLMQLLADLHENHTKVERLNMGLCPLVGIDEEPGTLINRLLHFVYANGDRFYSFKGLRKFKAKYDPEWHERYVVYKGGPTEFTRVMRALNKAMKVQV